RSAPATGARLCRVEYPTQANGVLERSFRLARSGPSLNDCEDGCKPRKICDSLQMHDVSPGFPTDIQMPRWRQFQREFAPLVHSPPFGLTTVSKYREAAC